MATLATNYLTLADWGKRLDPEGKVAMIAELLSQKNEILEDMLYKEGNLPTGEQTTIRTGLPSTYWRKINQGIPNSKSTTAQVVENAALLEARMHIDVDEAELNGNVNDYRASESIAFMEAMSQEMAQTMFYGSAATPEEFVGFANRYNDLSATNGQNILDAGGTGSDNTSIWLVGWGPQSCFGVFPKGSQAGIQHQDLGIDDVEDSDGNLFQAYKDLFKWKNGLVIKDWRYAVRIANVDVNDLDGQTGTQAASASTAVIKMMSRAIDRMPSLSGINPSFYVNRTVASMLRIAAMDKSNAALSIQEAQNQFGQNIFVTRYQGIPVRLVDQLLETETQVS